MTTTMTMTLTKMAVKCEKWVQEQSPEWASKAGLKSHTRNCQRLGISIYFQSMWNGLVNYFTKIQMLLLLEQNKWVCIIFRYIKRSGIKYYNSHWKSNKNIQSFYSLSALFIALTHFNALICFGDLNDVSLASGDGLSMVLMTKSNFSNQTYRIKPTTTKLLK